MEKLGDFFDCEKGNIHADLLGGTTTFSSVKSEKDKRYQEAVTPQMGCVPSCLTRAALSDSDQRRTMRSYALLGVS